MRSATYGLAIAMLVAGAAIPAPAVAESTSIDYRTGRFMAITPVRVHDSRADRAVGPGATIRVALGERLPAGVTAVVLNLTATGPTAATYVTAFAAGESRVGSTLNLRSGETRANQVTVGTGTVRAVDVYNNAGHTDVIVDLVGYYKTAEGAGFHSTAPQRVIDTRTVNRPMGTAGTRTVDFSARVPAGAVAVTFNLTATEITAATHLTAWPSGRARPLASNLNLVAGDTRANLVTVALGDGRSVDIYNHAGRAHIVVDLVGYYAEAGGSAFRARAPVREYDSRWPYPSGLPGLPIPPRSRVAFSVAGSVPAESTGIVLNVTGIDPTEGTYLTVWPGAESPRPEVSTVNVPAGRTVPNAAVLGLRSGDLVAVYNSSGRIHVAVDLLGYFLPEGD